MDVQHRGSTGKVEEPPTAARVACAPTGHPWVTLLPMTGGVPYPHLAWLLTLLLVCAFSGCAAFQQGVNSLDNWQSNRCDCAPNECVCGNHNCDVPQVAIGPPQGYLSEGAVFAGELIHGPPGKTAIDRVLELQDEVDQLRKEKEDLLQQLQLAEQRSAQQEEALDVAKKELGRAADDYRVMRRKLEAWYADVDRMNQQLQQSTRHRETMLEQFESELEEILTACQPDGQPVDEDADESQGEAETLPAPAEAADTSEEIGSPTVDADATPPAVSLAPPKNRATGRSSR